ncbi:MAG: hypothetical protein GEV13_23320 [Rhodospirillales bacterium]|nr:hypothetical protein [Rhodospirillales bacterium]
MIVPRPPCGNADLDLHGAAKTLARCRCRVLRTRRFDHAGPHRWKAAPDLAQLTIGEQSGNPEPRAELILRPTFAGGIPMIKKFAAVLLMVVLTAFAASGQTEGSTVGTPSVTVLGSQEVQGILGREVRSTADENMGRIVDVLVDGLGTTRAAIIDFGGFLGVGSRKIAVAWTALHFVPAAEKRYSIVLELTRDQVKPAPEYKEGKPVLVLVASGKLEPLP